MLRILFCTTLDMARALNTPSTLARVQTGQTTSTVRGATGGHRGYIAISPTRHPVVIQRTAVKSTCVDHPIDNQWITTF
jgi:hypothetical protein